ncbi:hypothetical protein BDF22DRAFT_653257 [Syncephalis plumigaleata]|nr:hypothetical protein BDF22DRAFT_653257 [Syncephalis plumigaleata]
MKSIVALCLALSVNIMGINAISDYHLISRLTLTVFSCLIDWIIQLAPFWEETRNKEIPGWHHTKTIHSLSVTENHAPIVQDGPMTNVPTCNALTVIIVIDSADKRHINANSIYTITQNIPIPNIVRLALTIAIALATKTVTLNIPRKTTGAAPANSSVTPTGTVKQP